MVRVKKIMKTEEFAMKELERFAQQQIGARIDDPPKKSNNVFMLANEALVLQTKACEFFIREVTTRAWRHADLNRRKTMQKGDIWASMTESEVFDFLIDIIPRATATTGTAANSATAEKPVTNSAAAANGVPSAPAPCICNTQTPLSDATRMMIVAPPTASNLENVAHPTNTDPPVTATDVAQPAFNLDNVSFVPMPDTTMALDETVQTQYPTPSHPWTLEGNPDL
jgi:histone H3/H4